MQYINDRNEDMENVNFNLKIHSKDRNLRLQKNPFNFKITFNPYANDNLYDNNNYYYILSKFENLKNIKISNITIPSRIYTKDNGNIINHVKIIKTYDNTAKILVENNLLDYIIEKDSITLKKCRKEYKLDNLENDIIIIKDTPCIISNIDETNHEITFVDNLPDFTIENLSIGNFNKSCFFNLTNNDIVPQIMINSVVSGDILISEDKALAIKVTSVDYDNNKVSSKVIYGTVDKINGNLLYKINKNYLNTYEMKCFFLRIKEFKQTKDTSNDKNLNESIGTFYPYSDNIDDTLLLGEANIEFYDRDLKNLNNMTLELLDSKGNIIGDYYNNFNITELKNDYHSMIIPINITVLKEKFN